ncbi:MAG TPA: Lrp/AsnC family transcriptional regulator [Firmicutes bacterium]|jgi:Lrp/AsnC family transcriptional regulator for asnA, asnC and gidA|nr:Lrp/AsnC family transcriptional regulator [Bacillota bacterium]HHT41970.1 Lrp/AsnC family transcriptional regulator [Bacillota bacterium]
MTGFVIDEFDREIIRLLQQDGRMPFLTIANQLGLAEGTVRRRVAKLRSEGLLKIVGIADPFKVGLQTVAIVGLKVERGRIESIAREVSALTEVRYVALSTGNYDLVIEVVVSNNDELLTFLVDKLSEIPGINNTGTSIVLKVAKEDLAWDV